MQLYVSMAQKTYDFTMRELLIRASGDPVALQKSLRAAVREVEPLVRNVEVRPLSRNQDESLRPWRLGATLFTVFGGLALVLATLGLYAVIAYGVTQRVREMGVRVALGAAGGDIVRLILGEGVRVAAVGVVIGIVGAIAASHWLGEFLFGISPRDPLTFAAVALVLLLVSIVASLVPALRATRVAPGEALRAE
jgi:ABC-type antimicrobial peptide transport system permease subunit